MNVVALVPIVVLAGILFLTVRAIARAVHASKKHDAAARCGKCSYEIADLSFDRCPECGGKLLEVGIVTPALIVRRESSVAGLIGSWTLAVVLTAILSFGIVGAFVTFSNASLPRGANTSFRQDYDFMPARLNQSQDYRLAVELDAVTNSSAKVRSGTIEIVIAGPDDAEGSVTLDAVTLAIQPANGSPAQQPAHPVTIDGVLEVFASAGLDVSDDRVVYEADKLFEIIAQVAAYPGTTPVQWGEANLSPSRGLRLSSSGGSSSSAPPATIFAGLNRNEWLLLLGGGFWLIVYVVGLQLMLLGRRRALKTTG
jgi:hypothetical protein